MTSLDNTLPTSSCSSCSEYIQENRLDFDWLHPDASRVVHQICSECDAFDSDTSRLCNFCSHIRPNHLLTCRCVHDIFGDNKDGNFGIVLGTPPELVSRQKDCVFGRWCLEIVQADARLLQHTIDEKRPVSIMRWTFLERIPGEPSIGAHIGWHAHITLCYYNTTSQFPRNDMDYHRLEISHNKRRRVLATNQDDTMTEPSLPEFELEDFSTPPPVVDWTIVRLWKDTCDKAHGNCHKGAIGKLPAGFRLIDVEMECVTATSLGPVSFSALSYVWGAHAENEITARRDNLSVLMQPYSLRNLPWTVSHAMHVCKQMGQRYLWVDRLCIVQDDREDKYGQIGSLEAIYSRADLVIVAACGDGIQSGLAGVNKEFPSKQQQFLLKTFGFTLANRLRDFGAAKQSAWDRRGWTYQEAVLSKRKLYFTRAEAWWECEGGHMRESLFSDGRRKDTGYWLRTRDTGDTLATDDIYEEYRQHVEQYSARILSYPSDIYHAFRGIENALYPDGKVIHGLPEADFSRALLWYPYDLSSLRERRGGTQDTILPSWSWHPLMDTSRPAVGTVSVTPEDAYFVLSITHFASGTHGMKFTASRYLAVSHQR